MHLLFDSDNISPCHFKNVGEFFLISNATSNTLPFKQVTTFLQRMDCIENAIHVEFQYEL